MTLPARQLQAFDFIVAFIDKYKRAPTLKNIRDGLNLKSDTEAHRYVWALVEKGFLFRLPGVRQSIRIVKYPEGATMPATGLNKPADPAQLQRDQIAYARGVSAGRAQLSLADASDAHALKLAYDKGYHDGHKKAREKQPKTVQDAFERGVAFGRKEMQDELTVEAQRDTVATGVPPTPSANLVLPFLRRSD